MLGITKLNSLSAAPSGPPPVLSGFVGYTTSNNSQYVTFPLGTQVGDWALTCTSAGGNTYVDFYDNTYRGDYYVASNTSYAMGRNQWAHWSIWHKVTQNDINAGSIQIWSTDRNGGGLQTIATITTVHRWQNYPNRQEFYGANNDTGMNGFGTYLNNNSPGRHLFFKYDFYNDEAPTGPAPSHVIQDTSGLMKLRLWESYSNENYSGVNSNYSNQSNYNMNYGYVKMTT